MEYRRKDREEEKSRRQGDFINNDEKEQTLAFLPLYLATSICLPICLFRCLFRCTRPLYQLMTSIHPDDSYSTTYAIMTSKIT